MRKLPYIMNGKDQIIAIRTKGTLKRILDRKLYKVQHGFLQLRDIKYKII